MQHNDLLTLRAQLAKAEKEARRAPKTPPPTPTKKPVKPQREADLAGIDTRDHTLARAHARLRDAILDGRYDVRPHAVGHARAEGFLEHDILHVLMTGRVKAVYPEDHRWLVSGTFEAHGFRIPLHAVVEVHERDNWMDIVTAFVPKNPHHVISRARLAVLLRWDSEQVKHRTTTPGNKPGNRSKGQWRKGA